MDNAQKLHIIAFDIPYPPDYGGVIDVFYKIKSLAGEGVKIILHCFQYGRAKSPELEELCEQVFYYRRAKGLTYFFSKLPYIVATRHSPKLLANLKNIKAPILFEGLHTCFFISHPELRSYNKIVRLHNVEHEYYQHLAIAEKNIFKQIYYLREAKKLKQFEETIKFANSVITISPSDQKYFKSKHPHSILITAFSNFDKITSRTGKGDYFLFHGNLSVNENKKAVIFLLDEVFNSLDIPLVIAGKNPPICLVKRVKKMENISLVANPDSESMKDLIENAQGCIIPTFQSTGLKLKLLASLYSGRYCITNSTMANNTGLENLCIIANSVNDIKEAIINYSGKDFTETEIQKREQILETKFSNNIKIKGLINLLS